MSGPSPDRAVRSRAAAKAARHVTDMMLDAVVARKRPDLPRFVVVRAAAIAAWQLTATTVIELSIDGVEVPRRTIQRWNDTAWFVTVTERDCRALGIDTGSRICLRMRVASAELPAELSELLEADPRARAAWEGLTASRQRMLRENIAASKRSATRERRARAALIG